MLLNLMSSMNLIYPEVLIVVSIKLRIYLHFKNTLHIFGF